MNEDLSKGVDLTTQKEQETVTVSREQLLAMQEQIKLFSQMFQKEVVHPAQPAQVSPVITENSNSVKQEPSKEVVLEEVDTASLFQQNPWRIGAKVRVTEKYPQIQGKISWKGRIGTITKILKDPSGVKMVTVDFEDVQVPFVRPHPTKPGVSQRGYRIQKATQTFDDSCLEPVYE